MSGYNLSDRVQRAMAIHEEYISKSSNPKWHRTSEEKTASFDFQCRNRRIISSYENKIYNDGKPYDKERSVTARINACKKSIDAFYEFQKFCYQSYGGTIYFQDLWEYCHNSKNECFSFVEPLEEQLNYLLENEEDLRYRDRKLKTLRSELIRYILENPDTLQKSIYSFFRPILKHDIQHALRDMERENIISRVKTRGSYIINIIK